MEQQGNIATLRRRAIRRRLAEWYGRARRELPWRRSGDPYRIWISEVMLQQTRAAAVVPYYERFLERFPDVSSLAAAREDEVLACWSGLGYYSRARNLHRAAGQIVEMRGFPREHGAIRRLAGVGDYTAAAIASIAFGLPHAVIDGNVLRVLSRLTNDSGDIGASRTRRRLEAVADQLLDRERPGDFNQALMELGATVCVPKRPNCPPCPLARFCEARIHGTQAELPVKLRRTVPQRIEKTLLVITRRGSILLRRRPADARRLAGFWELPEPEQVPEARPIRSHGVVRHSITNHTYRLTVVEAVVERAPAGCQWIPKERLQQLPLATTTRKALAMAG